MTTVTLQPGLPRDVDWTTFTVSQSGSQAIAVAPRSSISASTGIDKGKGKGKTTTLPVYLCSVEPVQLIEPVELLGEAFAVFASLPDLIDHDDDEGSSEDSEYRHRVCQILKQAYIQAIRSIQRQHTDDRDNQLLAHLALSHSLFALLPVCLSLDSLAGEQLLDWLNTLDPAPSTDDGVALASLADPWSRPDYFHYLAKAVLRGHTASASALLQRLARHPNHDVASSASALVHALESVPRSSQDRFRTERDFVNARRTWLASVHKLHRQIDQDWQDDDQAEIASIQAGLSWLVAILSGDQSRIIESVDDLREAVAVWGVWVNPSLRASTLPSVVELVAKELPTDSTDMEQVVTRAMLEQDWVKALQSAHSISPFLSAHLVALLPPDSLPTSSAYEPLPYYFYRYYADCLPSSMWKAKVTYLERARDFDRARAVLTTGTDSIDERIAIASALDWEDCVRALCLISANECVERGEWGKALAYEVRAGNRPHIERFVRQVLHLYVSSGAEEFVNIVDSFPTSLLTPQEASDEMDDDGNDDAPSFPSLVFLARYRDFLALYARNERHEAASLLLALLRSGVGSKFGFEPVMLLDSMPLLEPGTGFMGRDDCMELLRILEALNPTSKSKSKSRATGQMELVALLVGSNEAAEKQFRILRARIASCLASL